MPPSSQTTPVRSLQETLTAFLARYPNAETRRTYLKALQAFTEVAGPQCPLEAVTPDMVDVWHHRLGQSGLAAATVASRTKIVKAFWNWCVTREYVSRSPARFVVVKTTHYPLGSKAIPQSVLHAMFEAVQHKPQPLLAARDTAILALLITFGARVGDVARLSLPQVDLANHRITFPVKGGKTLWLPLPAQTGHYLATWLTRRTTCTPTPPHSQVFVSIHPRPGHPYAPLTATGIAAMIRRLSQQVSGRAYGPHAIRHWRGQTLADHRVAPTVVQAILGHSDVRITLEHYYNQDWTRVQQILDMYELV